MCGDRGILRDATAGARSAGRRHGAFLGLLFAILVIGDAKAQAQSAAVGVAKNAVGILHVTRTDGRVERFQGGASLPLFEGDELRTGAGAQALIELSDGTHLALNEQTTVVIRPHRPEDRGIIRIFKLFLGEIWIRTSKGPPPLEVETPVAIAAIRGTEFNLRVLRDGRSELTVLEGEVEFGAPRRGLAEFRGSPGSSPRAVCPVRAGTTSVGERGKPCTPPAETDVRRATAWIKVVK